MELPQLSIRPAWYENYGECDLCMGKHTIHPFICSHCKDDLALFKFEQINNNLLQWPAVNKLFPKRQFDQLFCLAPYVWPFDLWVKQLKYHNRFELAHLLGSLLVSYYFNKSPFPKHSHVISVPIHTKKWQQRGYNQAHLIAQSIVSQCNINYLPNLVIRNTNNISQVGQTGKERRQQLKQAFAVNANAQLIPERLTIIDDVITTGTTVNTLCRLLKKQGVKHITVVTIALTLP